MFSRRRQQFGGQGRSGGRGGRGRGRGRGGRRGGFQRANVTAEDLDAELDAYHDAVKIITPPTPFKIHNYVDTRVMELHQVKNKTFLMEYVEKATLSLNLLCF